MHIGGTVINKASTLMNPEIVFLVEEDVEGGYVARALGESIFAEAAELATLRSEILDAVRCHFPDPDNRPKLVRLHQVRDEVIAL